MHRIGPALSAVILLCPLASSVRGEERSALKEALALQETLRDIIKQAEPSIACVLISRSDVQSKQRADNQDRLDPSNLLSRQANRPDDLRRSGQRTRKKDLSDPENVPEAYGSGVVIDGRELLVLTNYHVIRDATAIYVRLPGNKASEATIYAADPRSDLAVLRLSNPRIAPLQEIKFGDGGKVRKGDFVVSLANPFAAGFRDGSPSASLGIVSNLRQRAAFYPREEDLLLRPLHGSGTLLQTDIRLNVGCSGGALLNLRGEMIALTTSRAALTDNDTAGGFAIPLDANVKRLIDKLRKGKEVEYGFLGVAFPRGLQVQEERDRIPIEAVTPGSPAQKASLRPGDVIKSINGVRVHTVEDLFLTIGMLLAGSEANLEIEGRRDVVKVKLVKFYVPGKIIASNKPALIRGFRVDYTSVLFIQQTSPAAGPFFGSPAIQPGVFVSEVQEGSRAATARLQVNDVITHVNGQEVNSPDEFYGEVQKVAAMAPLKLTLAGSGWPRNSSTELTIP